MRRSPPFFEALASTSYFTVGSSSGMTSGMVRMRDVSCGWSCTSSTGNEMSNSGSTLGTAWSSSSTAVLLAAGKKLLTFEVVWASGRVGRQSAQNQAKSSPFTRRRYSGRVIPLWHTLCCHRLHPSHSRASCLGHTS